MEKKRLLRNIKVMREQISILSINDFVDKDISREIKELTNQVNRISFFFSNKKISEMLDKEMLQAIEKFRETLTDIKKITIKLKRDLK